MTIVVIVMRQPLSASLLQMVGTKSSKKKTIIIITLYAESRFYVLARHAFPLCSKTVRQALVLTVFTFSENEQKSRNIKKKAALCISVSRGSKKKKKETRDYNEEKKSIEDH